LAGGGGGAGGNARRAWGAPAGGLRRAPTLGDVLRRRARGVPGVLGTAVLAGVLIAGPAAAGLADRIGATFTMMADEFIQAFQPVEGIVVSAEGEEIFLDIRSGWRGAGRPRETR